MKNFACLLVLCLCFACGTDAEVEPKKPTGELVAPTQRKVTLKPGENSIGNIGITPSGQQTTRTRVSAKQNNDLNGDGSPDRLEVVTTNEENDGLGLKRQLTVYTGEGADLDAWYTADDVILSTEHGGTMGDPLKGVSIENGTIVVRHFGGSRSKWNYVHRFRWQNDDFKLIGVTVESDDPCTELTELDYNLSTGNADYARTPQDCETGKKGSKGILSFRKKQPLPSMNGFKTGENRLLGPGLEAPLYY